MIRLILFLASLAAYAQPPIADLYGTSDPATCTVGQRIFRTDATAGQNIKLCTSTNTWTQVSGSGAAAILIDAKSAYGAVCDGSTNDATAIQDALTAAGTAGGTVFLPSVGCTGSYNLGTTGLTIPENVTLAGAGRVLSKIRYTGTGAAITMGASGAASRHHGIRDLSIDLESAGTGAIGVSGVRTFYDSIERVDIRFAITSAHQGQTGIKLDGGGDFGSGMSLRDVTMSGCMLHGIWYTGSDHLKSYTANVHSGGAIVQSCSSGTGMAAGTSITAATAANPSVITAAGHGIPVGALVKVSGVTGTIGAAINSYFVASAVTTDTITLEGSFGSGLAYTSGGTAQRATVGVYWHNGDQGRLLGTGVEDFEVGVASNRYGNEAHARLEGNTVDWLVTANSEGFVADGSFAPSTVINRGTATTFRSTSPAQEAARLFNLTAEGGLKVSGATGTELSQQICLAANPAAVCDVIWGRNYSGNSTVTTSSGNAFTMKLKAGTGQSTTDILQVADSSDTVLSRITSTGAFSGPVGLTNLTDLAVSKTSGTVLAVAAGVNSRGNTATSVSAATATITAGSGNGTAYVYITEGDVVTVEHPTAAGITISCSGCVAQQVTTPGVPVNSRLLATVTISSGAWGTVTDLRGLSSRPIVCGTGLVCTDSGGVLTTAIDTADVPRLGATNAFTGTVDATAGTLLQPRASGTPSSGACNTSNAVGSVYVNLANGGLAYDCMQTGSGTYGWVARGGSGGSPGGSGTEIQYRGGASTFSALANSSVPNAGELAISTAPSASSTRAVFRLGTAISGGSSDGTYFGVNHSGGSYTGNFMEFQDGGTNVFTVGKTASFWRYSLRGGNYPAGAYEWYSAAGNHSFLSMDHLSGIYVGHNASSVVNNNYSLRIPREGGIKLETPLGAKPTCDVDARGWLWHTYGGSGVKDNVEVCAKDASNAYAWRTLY